MARQTLVTIWCSFRKGSLADSAPNLSKREHNYSVKSPSYYGEFNTKGVPKIRLFSFNVNVTLTIMPMKKRSIELLLECEAATSEAARLYQRL